MIDEDDLTLEVEFTQKITVRPPDSIDNKVDADYWFHNDPQMILRDAIDVDKGTVGVLEINE